MNWLYAKWWKWLCVALLFYVLGSFFIPLAPGLGKVEPSQLNADSLYTFTVTGYNTHFLNAASGKVQLWLKSGNDFYCPQAFKIKDDKQLQASFYINSLYQDSISQPYFDVVVNDDYDGTIALREGIVFKKKAMVAADTGREQFLAHVADSAGRHLAVIAGDKTTDASVLYVQDTSAKLSRCAVEVVHNKHGFIAFPYREILYETIRNTFFHVPMWFTMTALVMFSIFGSINYLRTGNLKYDVYSHQAIVTALLFGICGLLTGSLWAKYTWGQFWVNDPKLNGAAVGVLIYFAYLVLRGSINDEIKRARIAAVYNVFALVIFMLFIFIIPRLTDSLHPGNGGNPAFSKYDLDNSMRIFFYPACIGWIALGFWILSILIRMQFIQQKQES
jgi:heme exporter protein C